MYRYDEIDQRIVDERVRQFRDQTRRFVQGELSEEEFRALRLRNGLYIQRYAPMLRISIPYGLLSSRQLRGLADIARRYDRGYGHFTTRQNLQLNWPRLEQVPDILEELARVQLHSIQACGNDMRNITADHFAGIAPDEVVNPFVWCELVRQWGALHPEFNYLPRKFKIAVSGAQADRAAVAFHDIGLHAVRDAQGEVGFRVMVGGGLGRTPAIGCTIREFLPWRHLLTYLEAILRIYNRYGRRDNLWKSRIKILVKQLGREKFREKVEAEWAHLEDGPSTLIREEIERIESRFTRPAYERLGPQDDVSEKAWSVPGFKAWVRRNVHSHRVPGYAAVTLSLKKTGVPPGDVTSEQMAAVADLAERFSFGELRVTHEQNLVLADVRRSDLYDVWQRARALGLATPNIGLLTDLISCPGGDLCSLANAKSLPVAEAIQRRFDDLDYLFDIGEIDLNISGCINACGQHHIGHIGILGVDKNGEECYQIELGGNQGEMRPGVGPSLGRVLGPSFARAELPEAVERLIECYLEHRDSESERFIDVVQRIGVQPFKERLYADAHQAPSHRRRQLAAA
ncbi:MAG TPA: nitrite/sulfite reductase [Burkholderiales bacterium]|nr:nitrite/sulfite reductase [Burkholderiales bacterium]